MLAADAAAFSTLKEMRAYEIAANMTRDKNMSYSNRMKEVSNILNNTDEKISAAESQATEEGLKESNHKRRVREILEQNRDQEVNDDTSDFALRGTFNSGSEGVLGVITDWIGNIVEKADLKYAHPKLEGLKPLKLAIPFTRIISNVANRTLEWTPWGAKRGLFGTLNRPISDENRKKLYIKALTGTVAMIITMFGSDDDGMLEITADGTGDPQKNFELAKNGWQKYSIKVKGEDKWISYKDWPLMSSLAMIGNIRDGQKYKSETLDNTAVAEKVALSYLYNLRVITDMTVLKNFGEFLGVFGTNSPAESLAYLEKLGASSLKSVVVPNLYSQVTKEIMRINDMPMKQVNHIWENLYRDIPIANNGMNDMVNSLGDPIIPDTDKFFSSRDDEDPKTAAVWDVIINNKAWVGRVSKLQLEKALYEVGYKKEISDQQYYEYSKLRGEKIKKKILHGQGENPIVIEQLNKMKPERVREIVDKYKRAATKEAKKVIFKLN